MTIGIAKKTYSVRLPNPKGKETRVCKGRATAKKRYIPRRVWSTLLCFSIWSMRDSISFPEDVRCADRAGRAGRAGWGAVAILL